ncbi:MAG: OmpA family protein [Proteobacteria bacterium]|nr:OmpA family protein [Pseudomonadota bacterium]MDA1325009.1 OmpA family protein [Pseudomonadota bacterium]
MTIVSPHPARTGTARSNWLVTFADLIALVLAFFVMMYATHRVEQGNWQAMVNSLSQSLNAQADVQDKPTATQNVRLIHRPQAMELTYLEALLRGLRQSEPLLSNILLHRLDDRLIIAFPGDLLFPAGRADLVAGAAQRIAVLANILLNVSNRIDVFGHTDPSPVAGHVFDSNWELSLARAETVASMLQTAGYPRKLGAFGLADTRFEDLAEIKSQTQKLKLARRVDIVVRPIREQP